jgi:hypothetical protein
MGSWGRVIVAGITLLAAVYFGVACGGGGEEKAVTTPTSWALASPAPSTPSPVPAVSTESLFQSMLESFTRRGLTLEQQVIGSLDGELEHVAALFSAGPSETTLVVLERRGSALETLVERPVEGLPPSVGASTWLLMQDANGDGDDELFVRLQCSTARRDCHSVLALDVREHGIQELPFQASEDTQGDDVRDLDGDGVVEVIGIDYDTPWIPHSLASCSSGRLFVVLSWRGDSFADASQQYAQFYATQIEEARERLVEIRSGAAGPQMDDCVIATAQTILYAHLQSGACREGWSEYLEQVDPSQLATDEWRRAIANINDELAAFVSSRFGCSPPRSVSE